jgi:polysaccharide transporter, PST family
LKNLFKNFSYLSLVQLINYGLPLIIIPFLISKLGLDKFGLINYAVALSSYFLVIVDFGFNLHGTKEVKKNINCLIKVSKINTSIYLIKLLLTIPALLVLILLTFLIPKLGEHRTLHLLTFFYSVIQTMIPVWIFQGYEKMNYNLIITVISKIVFLILILYGLVDYGYVFVPIAYLFSWLLAFIFAIVILIKIFKIYIIIPDLDDLKYHFNNSKHIFISQFSINFFRNLNPLILGYYSSDLIIGIYTTAEKIIKLIQSFQNPFGQALYPFLITKWENYSIGESLNYLKKKSFLPLGIFITMSLFGLLGSKFAIKYFVGEFNERIFYNFIILLPVIVIGGFNYYYGILGLISLGLNNVFKKAILKACSIGLVLMLCLNYFYQDIGASISFLLTEIMLLFFIITSINKIINEK